MRGLNPFLFPLAGVATGIFLASEVFLNSPLTGILLIGVSIFVWILTHIISKNPLKGYKYSFLHFFWIFLLFGGIGFLDYYFNCNFSSDKNIEDSTYSFTGKVQEVRHMTNGERLIVSVSSLRDSTGSINCKNLNILLKTDGYMANVSDIISFEAKPQQFVSTSPDSHYPTLMRHQGLSYYCNVKWDRINKKGNSSSLNAKLVRIKENLIIKLENSRLNRDTSNFLISILLGDKSFLGSEVKQNLNAAGLAHILALSGLHVAILFSILMILLFPLSLIGKHKLRRILALLLIWVYVGLTGWNPSTVRAGIMTTFIILAFVLERKNSALNSLFAAVFIIILIYPLSIWNVGLQFSFLSVATILIFTNRLNPVDHHSHPKTYYLSNLILITTVASLSTWILTAYYFKSISILFLPANILLLPLLPLFIAGGAFYLLLLVLGLNFDLLGKFLDIFYQFYLGTANFLSFSGKSTFEISIPLIIVTLLLTAIILFAVSLNSSKTKIKRFSLCCSVSLILLSFFLIPIIQPATRSTIKFPHSFTKIESHISEGNLISSLEFPRRSISTASKNKVSIMAIDRAINPDSLSNLGKISETKNNYLIVGPEADSEQIAELIRRCNFNKVVLHSGIGKNKKEELLHLLDETFWEKVYSLRETGSLEFDL